MRESVWVWVQVRPAERGVEPPGILSCLWSGRCLDGTSPKNPPHSGRSLPASLSSPPHPPQEAPFKADSTRPYDMAAISTSSPLISMSPTSTEHDFRFPRRPADSGPGDIKPEQSERSAPARTNKSIGTASLVTNGSPSNTHRSNTTTTNKSKNTAEMRGSLKEVRFDLSKTLDNARGTLSKTDAFAGFQDGIAGMSTSPADLGKEDPLAAQVWRFFSKTKQSLPNQERMENLTWRMMHASLRKQQLANDSSRYGCLLRYLRDASNGSSSMQCHAMRRNDKVLTCVSLPKIRWECSQRHRPVAKII